MTPVNTTSLTTHTWYRTALKRWNWVGSTCSKCRCWRCLPFAERLECQTMNTPPYSKVALGLWQVHSLASMKSMDPALETNTQWNIFDLMTLTFDLDIIKTLTDRIRANIRICPLITDQWCANPNPDSDSNPDSELFRLDSDSDSELKSKNPDSDSGKNGWIRIRIRIRIRDSWFRSHPY